MTLYTTKEAAVILRMKIRTLYKNIYAGHLLASQNRARSRLLITEEEVARYLSRLSEKKNGGTV